MKVHSATLFTLVLTTASLLAGNPNKHANKIDQLVSAALKKQHIEPNEHVSDDIFLRRTYLNIAGRVPTIEEAETFFERNKNDRRSNLVTELLNSEAYVSNAYHFWADLLRINGEPGGTVASAYELWVKDSLRENKPYDQMVYELITADGKIWDNGAVGYYFRDRGMPLDNMSNTVRIFLGTRLECAQCHNHPFDKWTQMDYFKMASFSFGINARNYDTPNKNMVSKHQKESALKAYKDKAKELSGSDDFPVIRSKSIEKYVQRFPNQSAEPTIVQGSKRNRQKKRFVSPHSKLGLTRDKFLEIVEAANAEYNKITKNRDQYRETLNQLYDPLQYVSIKQQEKNAKLPHDYQYSDADPHTLIEPATMFGDKIDLSATDESRITAYGKWMTSKDNPRFTQVIANRLWKEVFGRGIFEPVDELTDHTFVSNPELLDYLTNLMVELDYDMRAFLEILYHTQTYQREAHTEEVLMGAPYYFQGPVLRRMSAEQIWDSLVVMALPEADRYQPKLQKQLASINRVKSIYASLEEIPFDQFFGMVQEIAPLVAERRRIDEENRTKLLEAREADDNKAFMQLKKDIGMSKKNLNQKISDIAFPHLNNKVDGEELLLAMGVTMMSDSTMAPEEAASEYRQVMLSLPKLEMPEMPAELKDNKKNRNAQKAWQREQKVDFSVYRNLIAGMARASELPSPSRRGHFLRDFGQSDREVIENASHHASVPQALNLLNGPMVQSLTNRFSVFGKRLHAAGTPEEKAELIFQAMLTRKPTEEEIRIVTAEVNNRGNSSYEGVVWALLNTQQFMFIQ